MAEISTVNEAKSITDDAVTALWSLYKRPKPGGGEWGDVANCKSKADFAKQLGSRVGKLGEECRMAFATPGITAQETSALEAYLEIDRATEPAHRQSGEASP